MAGGDYVGVLISKRRIKRLPSVSTVAAVMGRASANLSSGHSCLPGIASSSAASELRR